MPSLRTAPLAAVLAAVILATAGGCATSGVNRGDLNVVSLEEEWQLGEQLAADLARQLPLVGDATANAYIDRMGQQIVAQTEMARLPWHFHVVADPAINAFNIPGGHVYVNTGLIEKAGNAAELSGVMAHEIAHGVSRHATEQMTKTYGLSAIASLLLGNNPAVYQQILAQIAATGTVAKWSRDAEREADQLGIRYMYEAGYNPDGMASMFEKLLSERSNRSGSVTQFFSTHPLTEERLRDARQRAARLPDRSGLVTRDGRLPDIQQRLARYNR